LPNFRLIYAILKHQNQARLLVANDKRPSLVIALELDAWGF